MGNILVWALSITALCALLYCAVDLGFNKSINIIENLSSGTTVLVLLFAVMLVSLAGPNSGLYQEGSAFMQSLSRAAAEAIPFYQFLADAKNGVGLMQYYKGDFAGFLRELLQAVFLAVVIPVVVELIVPLMVTLASPRFLVFVL